jgi:hypothetical protein
MKPRWRVITIEERGGRLVYLLQHEANGERVRIYRRGKRWRFYDLRRGDEVVVDRHMIAAIRRRHATHAGEREAQRSLFPTSGRRVKAVHKDAPAVLEHPGA